jgi:hypothetical protein
MEQEVAEGTEKKTIEKTTISVFCILCDLRDLLFKSLTSSK